MYAEQRQSDARWSRTRAALIKGGRRVLSQKGVDAATVQEIVRAAGVSQPSFYNHFETKAELAELIAEEFFRSDAAFKVDVFEQLHDAALAIAINSRHTLSVATRDPVVAWVVVRAGVGRNLLKSTHSDELTKMIVAGVDQGRFAVACPRTAALMIRGAAYPMLQDILQGRAAASVGADFAELVLRMLGLSRGEAAELALQSETALEELHLKQSAARE